MLEVRRTVMNESLKYSIGLSFLIHKTKPDLTYRTRAEVNKCLPSTLRS